MSPVALNGSPAQQVTAPEATQPLTQTALLGALQTNTQPTKASGDISPPESLAQAIAASPVDSTSGGSENKPEMVGISKADASMLPYAMNAAALWAMTQATEKAQVTSPTAEDPSEAAKVQLNLMASAAPTAFWMLRNPMVATPSKEAPALPASIALSEIDLSQAATPELLESLSPSLAEGASLNTSAAVGDQAAPVTGHTGQRLELAVAVRQDPPNPQASAPAPDSGSAQRSENVQNLAEKMGQAVGQRILSEIEKGQWHLKLMLRPATLGHIEVEMRMRSGELDAVFTAPQAVTRELLQEGLSKLKDTLNQMGMDVASMQVGDGQSQKRGGESTSKQMSKSTKDNSDDPKSSTSAVKTPTARTKMGQDGWDVLV